MARDELIICDQCGRGESYGGVFGWVHISAIGQDFRTFPEKPLKGDFCCRECAAAYLMPEPEDNGNTS